VVVWETHEPMYLKSSCYAQTYLNFPHL
jgi:hypothetical protein